MAKAAPANLPDSALENYPAKTGLITFTPGTITAQAEFIKEIQMKFSGVSPAAGNQCGQVNQK